MHSRNIDFLSPSDMAMLERVLAATMPPGAQKCDREERAAILVRLYQSGVDDEAELLRHMQQPDPIEISRPVSTLLRSARR